MSELAKRELASFDARIAYLENFIKMIEEEPDTLSDRGDRIPVPISTLKTEKLEQIKKLKRERTKAEKMYRDRGWLEEDEEKPASHKERYRYAERVYICKANDEGNFCDKARPDCSQCEIARMSETK